MLSQYLKFLSIFGLTAILAAGFCAPAADATELVIPATAENNPDVSELFAVDSKLAAFLPIATPSDNFVSFESPNWAADGEQLTYVSVGKAVNTTGGTDVRRLREIWIQSADRTERRRVTRDGFDYLPVFSNDAKRIAFIRNFPARNGGGCMRGGYGVAIVSTRTLAIKRISRCFASALLRSSLQFVDDGRQVAFVGDRRRVTAVRVTGVDAALAKPATIYKQPENATVVSIRAAIPKAAALWIDFEDGRSVLVNSRMRATKLPDASFAVSPTGKIAIGNCGALPTSGMCAIDVRSRLRSKLKSPFTADFSQDSAEFGFSFSSDGRSLASFGYGLRDALNGLSDLQLCIREALSAAPDCKSFTLGSVSERDSDVALWQPRPSGA